MQQPRGVKVGGPGKKGLDVLQTTRVNTAYHIRRS